MTKELMLKYDHSKSVKHLIIFAPHCMYRRFYLLVNLSNPLLAFWTVPAAQSLCVTQTIPTSAPLH
jgi:hypothetical protein